MKRLRFLLPVLCVAGLAVVPTLAAETGGGAAPDAAPASAAEFAVADFAGHVVVVDFWASWCAPCREALPWLNAMQEKYGERGLQVVMVNLDRKAGAAREMEAEIGAGIRQFRDPQGDLAGDYDLQGMPSTYIYDRDGKLVASHVGFLKADADAREREIADLLGEGEAR